MAGVGVRTEDRVIARNYFADIAGFSNFLPGEENSIRRVTAIIKRGTWINRAVARFGGPDLFDEMRREK